MDELVLVVRACFIDSNLRENLYWVYIKHLFYCCIMPLLAIKVSTLSFLGYHVLGVCVTISTTARYNFLAQKRVALTFCKGIIYVC